jgi:hypothetical protein
MTNRAIQTLNELVLLGFTNKEFQAIHHRGQASSIRAHLKYLAGLSSGHQPNGTNAALERRLEQKLRELRQAKELRELQEKHEKELRELQEKDKCTTT